MCGPKDMHMMHNLISKEKPSFKSVLLCSNVIMQSIARLHAANLSI